MTQSAALSGNWSAVGRIVKAAEGAYGWPHCKRTGAVVPLQLPGDQLECWFSFADFTSRHQYVVSGISYGILHQDIEN